MSVISKFILVFFVACFAVGMIPPKKETRWIEVNQVLIPKSGSTKIAIESAFENQNQIVRAVKQLQREVDLLKSQKVDDGKRAVPYEEPTAQ